MKPGKEGGVLLVTDEEIRKAADFLRKLGPNFMSTAEYMANTLHAPYHLGQATVELVTAGINKSLVQDELDKEGRQEIIDFEHDLHTNSLDSIPEY